MEQSLINRLQGIITLKAPIYKEVAEDVSATRQAVLVVIISGLLAGLGQGLAPQISVVNGQVQQSGGGLIFGLAGAVFGTIANLIGWAIGGWLTSFVATKFFQGQTNTNEMLRVTGFTRIFNAVGLLAFIPGLGAIAGLVGAVLGIIGNVIGIREAAGFDTTKAILTAIIVGVIVFVVVALITSICAGIILVPLMLASK